MSPLRRIGWEPIKLVYFPLDGQIVSKIRVSEAIAKGALPTRKRRETPSTEDRFFMLGRLGYHFSVTAGNESVYSQFPKHSFPRGRACTSSRAPPFSLVENRVAPFKSLRS